MKTRNQRQRKKLHLAEFQELGFLVNWQFAEGTSIELSMKPLIVLLLK